MTRINSSVQNKLPPNLSLRNENKPLGKGAKRGRELKPALKREGKLSFGLGGGGKKLLKSSWKKVMGYRVFFLTGQ